VHGLYFVNRDNEICMCIIDTIGELGEIMLASFGTFGSCQFSEEYDKYFAVEIKSPLSRAALIIVKIE
jgi:hypothetical protein